MGRDQGIAGVEIGGRQHRLDHLDGHPQVPEPLDDLGGRDLVDAIVSIARVLVHFRWFEQPHLMVVAQRLNAQVGEQRKVANGEGIVLNGIVHNASTTPAVQVSFLEGVYTLPLRESPSEKRRLTLPSWDAARLTTERSTG